MTIEFETEDTQQVSAFLIGRRNITPVVEWDGEIYKNKEKEFRIHFEDDKGQQPEAYTDLQWTAEFRNMTEDIVVPLELEAAENGLFGKAAFTNAGKYSLYLTTGRNSENAYDVSQLNVLNTLPVSISNERIDIFTAPVNR